MHETVIIAGIIEEAKKYGEVEEISLEIGELAHVPAHELIESFERMVDWKITYKEKKSKIKCTCGFVGHPKVLEHGHDFFFIECPKCKKSMPEILEGKDIKVIDVKVK